MRAFLISLGAVVLAAGCTDADDGGITDPSPAACTRDAYRIASVTLPRSGAAAAQIALDLDGDGDGDNELGRLNATLATFYSDWRPDDRLTAALAREVPWFITVERCEGEVAIDLVQGDDADHDGRWRLAPGGDAAIGDDLLATFGEAALPVFGFTDPLGLSTAPGWVSVRGVAVSLQGQDGGDRGDQLDAIVGVGLELTDEALGPVAAFLTHHLPDSVVARALDADHDGVITVTELRASPTIAQLIANDIDVAGSDGVADRASLAFTLHAAAVTTE